MMNGLPPHLPQKTIHIGGVFASRTATIVHTVLGSCVSSCLFDPQRRIGGMNHFLLPDSYDDDGLPTRYGINAMEVLINEILKLGGDRRRLQAKIFGGAAVLTLQSELLQAGEKNVCFVRQFLETESIPVVGQRLGGIEPLEVYFFTESARALVRPIRSQNLDHLVQREARYRTALAHRLAQLKTEQITLF